MFERFEKQFLKEKIISFITVVIAVAIDFFMFKVYLDVYGTTGKMYTLFGAGVAVLYMLVVHYLREITIRWSNISRSSYKLAVMSSILIGIVCFFAKERYLAEEYSFFAMLVSYVLLISCTRMGTGFGDYVVTPPVMSFNPISYPTGNVSTDDTEEVDLKEKDKKSDAEKDITIDENPDIDKKEEV